MSLSTAFSFVMLALKLANWITSRINRAEWQRLGYNQAAAEQLRELQMTLGIADEAVKAANSATPKQRKDILEGDL
jgi:hypothetical protein